MPTMIIDKLFALLLLCLGFYISWQGVGYGHIVNNVPGPGFFPIIVGGMLVVSSVSVIYQSLKKDGFKGVKLEVKEVLQVIAVVSSLALFIVLSQFVGMLISSIVYMLLCGFSIRLSVKDKSFNWKILILSLVVTYACYLIFSKLLRVPLI
ncbi:tripartite tricarboxylate transporter TctB family protein [Halomonas daqingensis]|uniref:Tripartite tricarboxylate transporter TctB family protein n=1 Tax=Billgrantia desiderata TaxID=52021 RepID=A0ABS9B4M4_9GAMM|nr:tripartite tricarboxylate transporter TctB family protein [Halomonas desiderata]MCE8042342.1 tripartite tricarboxylate transporter TctB family protein [Halomonas desiderata]MCE8046917.1 tripartite tricarboxylate transporter TctB family protein [Halomonas desiderata]